MTLFDQDLIKANESIKTILKENRDIAEHPFHKRDETLMSILNGIKSKHPDAFINWVEQKNLHKIEVGIHTHIKSKKYSFSADGSGIHLKHGAISLGSYPYKNIHSILQELGHKEKSSDYYVLVLYMIESPRLEIFNVDSVLNKMNTDSRH
jgi:hypothetical protein